MNDVLGPPLATLEHVPGLQVDLRLEPPSQGRSIDAIVEVRSRAGVDRYAAEATRRVSLSTLPAILNHLQHRRHDTALAPLLLTGDH